MGDGGGGMRLQRFLAKAGIASRRKAEELILAGQVKVNGRVVRQLGTKVDGHTDKVAYQGRRVYPEDLVWLVMNKPDQTVCSSRDPEGRTTVLDLVERRDVRLYPVGRLDFHTQGTLLLTNDGDLCQGLLHPSAGIDRTYHVKLKGLFDSQRLDPLREGVTLDTGEKVSAQVSMLATTGKHTWVEMVIKQGLNHQIHRMAACVALDVLKLIRVSFGPLTADGLKPGATRPLTQGEINDLRSLANLPAISRRPVSQNPYGRAQTRAANRPKGRGGKGKPSPRKQRQKRKSR